MNSPLKSATTECRKFAPNIFNKSKCQNCFRTKDAHSAEALESNRATRKVSTCGYLFVAPDWDFSQAVNRTRRWQRRWFVLYDDGELTYSVDEHPNTIPQAVIDMTKVVAVSHAEELTGNQFSIAITTPDKVHFVKGTGRDDSKWWFDVLSQFPSNMVRSKNKHNACNLAITKPSPTVNILSCQNQYDDHGLGTKEAYRNGSVDIQPTQQPPEHRANGTTNSITINNREAHVPNHNGVPLCRLDSGTGSGGSGGGVAYMDADALAKSRSRRYLKRESRGLKSQRSRSDGVAKMVPGASRASELLPAEWAGERGGDHHSSSLRNSSASPPPCPFLHNPVYLLLAEPHGGAAKPGAAGSRDNKNKQNAAPLSAQQLLLNRWQNELKGLPPSPNLLHQDGGRPWRTDESSRMRDGGDGGCGVPHSPPCRDLPPQWNVVLPPSGGGSHEKHLSRGVPDGCGQGGTALDTTACDSKMVQHLGEAMPEDLFVKKGWLMRLGPDGEWSKHWFVLRNASLTHFDDPSAEDSGDPSATLDLRMVREVKEVDLDRSYAFVITLWEADEVVLCAVTAGIRTNWVQAIRQAVRNRSSASVLAKDTSVAPPPMVLAAVAKSSAPLTAVAAAATAVPPTLAALEGRLPIETSSSDDHSEYFSIVDEDEEDVGEDPSRALPPSPPLNRTAISRVKERARSRSNSRSRQSRRLRSPQPTQGTEPVPAGSSNDPDEAAHSDRSSSWDRTAGMDVVDSKPQETSRSATPSKAEAPTATCPSTIVTDTIPASARRPPVSRTSRRSSSLREVRTKKLESRCSELEDQLRARDRELGQLRSAPHGSLTFLRGLPHDEVLQRSLEALEAFLSSSVEKLCGLKERLRKTAEEGIASSADGLRLICGELESLIRENSRRVGATTRALRCSTALETEGKLSRAAEEAWVLRRELKRSQDAFDDLELRCHALKRDSKNAEEMHASQLALMTARIDDLTAKLALSEKAQRQLRQRLARADSKQEKRRLSLKGKEAAAAAAAAAANPSKELEVKLAHLEHKLALLEEAFQGPVNEAASDASAPDDVATPGTPTGRRSSLDSLSGDQQNLLLRVQLMDQRLQSALEQPTEPLSRPRICLQTEAPDGNGVVDGWSSLSLATSVTDLRLPEHGGEALPASYKECVESLDSRLDALLGWLYEALASLREAGVMGAFPRDLFERVGARDSSLLPNQKGRLARNLALLRDIGLKLTATAGFDARFSANVATHLRETSLVLFAFEERLDHVACSHDDLRLVGAENYKLWDPLGDSAGAQCCFAEQEDSRDAEALAAELADFSSRLKSLNGAVERFSKSRHTLVLKRLSECLDVHPTSDLEPDAVQNVAEQEAVLGAVMEALSVVRTHISDSLWHTLCSTSEATSPATSMETASLLKQLENAMRAEFLRVRSELRTSCLSELESYCSANLPRDVLGRELVPVVRDLATANCVSAVLRTYVLHIEELVKDCVRALRQDELGSADAGDEKTQQELFFRAAAAVESAPQFLQSWLMHCLAEDPCENDQFAGACVNSTADVTGALERLNLRLREEREGHRQRVLALQDRLDATQRDCERLLKTGCATCRGLREQVRVLAQRSSELERAAREGSLCERCPAQQEQLRRLGKEHAREMAHCEASAQEELQGRMREQEANHQRAVQGLEAELRAAKSQLQRLQEEQEERIGSLRELYQQKLSSTGLEAVDAEAVRLRCRPEMEQLKHLCEKGLAALEASHGRLVAQLQERHQAEMDRLRAERDRALQEETKATLAALNAMQRAHQEELHREISSFKEDYAQRMRHGRDAECLHREHQEERELIKQEILSLSEKYSFKCLEKASLEERLQRAGQQLQEANYQVLDLLARNKQLASHLGLQILQHEQAVSSDNSPEALEKLLQLRDSQLVQQREENAQVLHSLQLAKTKINQLNSQCQQLSNSLRAERNAHQAESQRLQARLEGLVVTPTTSSADETLVSQSCRPVPERRSSLVVRKQVATSVPKADSHQGFSRSEPATGAQGN
ncbi:myosin phosphatase Rho interacting protein outspread isoform X2 [Haemaphysalis longicornis]